MNAEYEWLGDEADIQYLKNGVLHLAATSAIAHAKAMLGIKP